MRTVPDRGVARLAGRRVSVPPFSRQRHILYVEPAALLRGLETAFSLGGGRESGAQAFDCTVYPGQKDLLVVAEGAVPARVRATLGRAAAGAEPRVLTDPQALPDHHLGYSGFRAAFFASADYSRLSAAQQSAALDWVCLGGRLTIDRPALDALPAAMRATIESALAAADRGPDSNAGGWPSAPLGLGRVFAPAALRVGERTGGAHTEETAAGLPPQALAQSPAPPWPSTSRWASRLAGTLPLFRIPTRAGLLAATAMYAAAVGPLLWLLLARRHRLASHAWWILCLLSLACGAAVVASYRLMRGRTIAAECITFVRVVPTAPPIGLAETAVAVISPGTARFDLIADVPGWMFLPSSWPETGPPASGRPLQEDPPRLHALCLNRGESRLAYGRHLVHGLSSPWLRSDPEREGVYHTAGSGLPAGRLERALLILPHSVSCLEVARGGDGQVVLRPLAPAAVAAGSRWDEMRDHAALVLGQDAAAAAGEKGLLAAWILDAAAPVRIAGAAARVRSHTLLLLPVRGE